MAERKTVLGPDLKPRTLLTTAEEVTELLQASAQHLNANTCRVELDHIEVKEQGAGGKPFVLDPFIIGPHPAPEKRIFRFRHCHFHDGLVISGAPKSEPDDPSQLTLVFSDCTGPSLSLQQRIRWVDLTDCNIGEVNISLDGGQDAFLFSRCAFDVARLSAFLSTDAHFSLDFRARLFYCNMDLVSVTPNIGVPTADCIVSTSARWANYFRLACPTTPIRYLGNVYDL